MNPFSLENKVAIVTGGSTGIGRCIALEFASAGADIVVGSLGYVDRLGERIPVDLGNITAEIEARGRKAAAMEMDVRVPEQVESLVKLAADEFGRIDILVNNAGSTFACPLENLTPNGWDAIININLKGTYLCSRAAGRIMMQQKSGRIINIASMTGISGSPRMSHYGAAKAGVINLTKSLAREWAEYNINVNAIAPGYIETEGAKLIVEKALNHPPEAGGDTIPHLLRPGRPEDVALTAVFLASEASRYISGETVPVKGATDNHG